MNDPYPTQLQAIATDLERETLTPSRELAISLIRSAHRALEESTTPQGVNHIREGLRAIEEIFKLRQAKLTESNLIVGERLRAEHKLGALLEIESPHGGDRKSSSRTMNLKIVDINPNQSAAFRHLSEIEYDELDAWISDCQAKELELSTALAIHFWKEYVRGVTVARTDWSDIIYSASDDETQIIKWIMDLYNDGQAFDLDPTYSTGRLWEGLPRPQFISDLHPIIPGCHAADVRHLPFADGQFKSIFFDPPFVAKDTIDRQPNGIIESRFTGLRTIHELQTFYAQALHEFKRLLKPGGILAFKCQDGVSGSIQYLHHIYIVNLAEEIGLHCEDLFILYRANAVISPNMKHQQHARKNHCYYLVLIKR